jgi:hypothetical protein
MSETSKMKKIPDLREVPDLPPEIKEAALDGELALFVGAGVSRLVGLPSWAGLAEKALTELRENNLLNYSEQDQLKELEPKKQLSITMLIAKENNFDLNLTKYLQEPTKTSRIYEYLNSIGCVCITTNYDILLSPEFCEIRDGSTVPVPINRIFERDKFFASHLNRPGSVIQLHGSVSDRESMVVTTKDYLNHYDHPQVLEFLSELFAKKTVLFLGYGLEESEILEHILRRGFARDNPERRRFALHPFFISQKPLYEKLYEYYKKSFGVHLIGFVRDHKDYFQLEDIIKSWGSEIKVRTPTLVEDFSFMAEVLGQ